ncbi:MAG: ribonuclease Z [Nanoarchaeota archaeon]
MEVKVTFLGTSCMMPTPARNHPAVLLTYKSDNILLDCGENTQRQLKIAKISPASITKILITHWHGDHILGLPGLVQSLIGHQYSGVLEVYGPHGTRKNFEKMLDFFVLRGNQIKIKVQEVKEGVFFKGRDFQLETIPLKHTIPCLAYAFQETDKRKINLPLVKKLGIPQGPLLGQLQKGEDIKFKGRTIKADKATTIVKGKKVTYITDTSLTENCYKIAKNSDLLISESTYLKMDEERAVERDHLTAGQAALIAKKANCRHLALTHYSQRYKDSSLFEKEARKIFKNTKAMNDFDVIRL